MALLDAATGAYRRPAAATPSAIAACRTVKFMPDATPARASGIAPIATFVRWALENAKPAPVSASTTVNEADSI
jgi:hypothetical protein